MVLPDLDPELYGLLLGVPVGILVLHSVLCCPNLTRASGSSSELGTAAGRLDRRRLELIT